MDTINRLQFRHHNEIFETREDAIEYIYDKIKEEGEGIASGQNSVYSYSLFAEPAILRYKNEDDEAGCEYKKGPHIMLVIGSETNDTIYHDRNKFCIIDIDKTEEEIKNLEEEIEKIIKSLTVTVFDTSTLDLHVEKTDEGTFLSGDVKTAETHVFDGVVKNNNLMTVPMDDAGGPEGLFIYVDLTYDDVTETFTFIASQSDGTLKKTSVKLPNNYLVSGEYKRQDESLHLKMRSGDEVVVNCEELIAEWGVEGDASKTPIVLTREEVDYDHTDEHHHVEPWQDVLRADVRLANDRPANILKKTTDGRYLYVDGVASNILYYWNGERSNVEEQLNKLNKIRISPDNDNIIWNRADGFFASTKLDYNSNDNKLIFTTSTVNGQPFVKEIQLNTVEVIESITYDPTREVLVVKYKNDKGETKTIYVPVSGLIDEWEVLNDAHSVKLVKQRKVSGKDILTADVNISTDEDNILVERGEGNIHALFVRGTADNIKYKDTTVEGALDALAAEDEAINEKLDGEIARAKEAEQILDDKINQEIADRIADVDEEEARAKTEEQRIDSTIGSGFTTDTHETVAYKFEQLQNKVNEEADKLQNEIDRSTEKDNEHDERLDEQQAEIEAVSADSANSLKSISSNDSINIDSTDHVNPVIRVNLSNKSGNTINLVTQEGSEGLYSSVDISYDSLANELTLTKSASVEGETTSTTVKLNNGISIIERIEYDSATEEIVIYYKTTSGKEESIRIPVSHVINEWTTGETKTVLLNKERVVSGGPDILTADVKVCHDEHHQDNAIEVHQNGLYVHSYSGEIADLSSRIGTVSGDVISEIARAEAAELALDEKVENEMARAQSAETALQNAINAEEERAKTEEQRIDSTIGSGFTTDTHETVTYKFEQLQNQVNSEAEKLQNEIDRSTEKDDEHDAKLAEQQAEIEVISADSKASLKDIINNDHSIDVDKTDPVKPVISVNLSEHQPYNTIRLEGDGLYSFIDLRYDYDTNKLTFVRSEKGSTENVEKEIQLNSVPFDIRYDKDREVLIITYRTSEGDKTVEIDLHDLIHDEWTVRDTNTIELHKDLSVSGSDILTADVKICHHEDNAIEEHNDGLYVHSYSGEIADLGSRIDTVSGEVIAEKARAEEADNNLANSIATEKDRAIAAENGLNDEIEAERRRAEAAEAQLQLEIDAVSADSANSLKDISCTNGSINVDKSDPVKPIINVVKCHEDKNALEIHNDGLFVYSYSGEIINLDSKIDTVSGDVITEKARAEEAENNLANTIAAERDRAIAAENGLHDEIEAERRRAEAADTELYNAIQDEKRRAEAADTQLEVLIGDERTRAMSAETELSTRITNINDSLANEVIRSTNKDIEHDTAINSLGISAHSLSDRILQEAADRNTADASLRELINTEKSDRIAQDTVITERLSNEINRSTAEDDRLNTALQQEINDRTSGDAELEQAIRDAMLTFANTTTAKMSKSSTNVVTTDVIVPIDDNIIIVDEGIKAFVGLSYNAANNTLILEKTAASGHTYDTVQLNAGSIIESITYDNESKELVIRYESTSEPGVQHETRVGVSDLFNPWIVKNLSEKSAVELNKTYRTGPLAEDELSARVLITDDRNGDGKPDEGSDNIIEIRNNGLYVDGSLISGTSEAVECLQNEIKAFEKAVIGHIIGEKCGSGYTYEPNILATYINSAQSFDNADFILDQAIKNVEIKADEISAKTDCIGGETEAIYHTLYGTDSTIPECGDGLVYTPDPLSCVLSGATSFMDADKLMAYQICEILEMWVSGMTCTTTSNWIDEGANKKMLVDVRASYGKTASMTDEDIYITDITGKTIEHGVKEFTDTNALRIVCLDDGGGGVTPDVSTKQNGIYLSNAWNCGKYYQESTEAEEMSEVGADGYNVNYFTDESEDGNTIDYSNYLRC